MSDLFDNPETAATPLNTEDRSDAAGSAEEQGLNRRSILRGAAGLSALALGSSVFGTEAEAYRRRARQATTSFTLAVLPDTQFYSRYATPEEHQQYQTAYGSTPFDAQVQYIVNSAAQFNIPFTIHLGDVVDQSRKDNQWRVADAAMKKLEAAGLPYSICAGNHDVASAYEYLKPEDQNWGTDKDRKSWQEPYLKWFPASRAAKQKTFLGRDPRGWHEAHKFTAFGVSFMVLSLSWRASDEGLNWANGMIKSHPDLPVILVNHQLVSIGGDGMSAEEVPYGNLVWDRLIRRNDQIFMTLNGHNHGGARLRKINDFGNPVDEMVVDYQMAYQGGNGLMRLYEFDFSANKIDVASFSPWVVKKPKPTLTHLDRAWLTESNHQFTIDIDFKQRFARFTNFTPALADSGAPILPQVKRALFADFVEQQQPVVAAPRDQQDYPVVEGTLAHWRIPAAAIGAPVAFGAGLTDLTGHNPMHRMVAQAPYSESERDDVVFTEDRHHLSSAPGSIRFCNTHKRFPTRLSCFSTETNAPLNAETFKNGYTIEAFIKFDADWMASDHRWGNILSRGGNRGDLPGFRGGDREAPPILFSISNLREVQWEVVPSSSTVWPQANWSGEIMRDTWYHVAAVNDPKTRTTTLYIEGAPVIRGAAGEVGIASLGSDKPWIIGASFWMGQYFADGWFGNIGEVRIVDRPLAYTDWLTARRMA